MQRSDRRRARVPLKGLAALPLMLGLAGPFTVAVADHRIPMVGAAQRFCTGNATNRLSWMYYPDSDTATCGPGGIEPCDRTETLHWLFSNWPL